MRHEFLPTKVSVLFYTRPEWDSSVKSSQKIKQKQRTDGLWVCMATLSRTKIHHCGIMLERDDKTVVLITGEHHRSKLIDEEAYHTKVIEPLYAMDIGLKDVSIKQIHNYLKTPYRISRKDLFIYCLLSRFILPSSLPNSCTLLVCQILRMVGYNIRDYVIPRDLYNNLNKTHLAIPWKAYAKELRR